MATSTASVVLCPECGTQTATYCATNRYGVKIRYRKCSKCQNRIKTVQPLETPLAGERIVPIMTPQEHGKFLAELRAKQAGTRSVMHKIHKLTKREIAEIKYLLKNKIQTQAYTAMQYGIRKEDIHSIAVGDWFADIPTPRSLAEL